MSGTEASGANSVESAHSALKSRKEVSTANSVASEHSGYSAMGLYPNPETGNLERRTENPDKKKKKKKKKGDGDEEEEDEEKKEEEEEEEKKESLCVRFTKNLPWPFFIGSLIVYAICVLLLLYFIIRLILVSPDDEDLQEAARLGSNGTDNPNDLFDSGFSPLPSTSTIPTTPRYKPLSAQPRVATVDLTESTYGIISSSLTCRMMGAAGSTLTGSATVVFALQIMTKTTSLKLHSGVTDVGNIIMKDPSGKRHVVDVQNNDESSQLLTIELPLPVEKGNITIEIRYNSLSAFEALSFPCAAKTCSVYFNRPLRYFVPHFAEWMKHTWKIELTHPPNNEVLTNSMNKTSESAVTKFETKPLLPSELSILIVENLVKETGNHVESYRSEEAKAEEVKGLVTVLDTAISSITTVSQEKFQIVVVPAVETYKFYGRNVAVVGENMLKSSEENKLNFVWTWIFRTMIYDKVTSADRNPTWIYDISAFFLSTTFKSTNKDIWRRHLYEVATEMDHKGVQGSGMLSMKYQDEYRYYEQLQHVAKISTLLQMMIGLGVSFSGDPVADLSSIRDPTASSGKFFFLRKDIPLKAGGNVPTDSFMTSCFDSPDLPRVDISRSSPTQVVIQRSNVDQVCEIILSLDLEESDKDEKYLKANVKKVEIASKLPVLLTGEVPFSAIGYTMEQAEFDKLLQDNIRRSYGVPSQNMLASNAVRAAGDGLLSYESVKRLMDKLLQQKTVSVDEAVDLWTSVIGLSRKDTFKSLTIPIIKSSLEAAGRSSEYANMPDYVVDRFNKSLQESPLFMIQRATMLVKNCGDSCFQQISDKYAAEMTCVDGSATCSSDAHTMEIYTCSKVATGGPEEYAQFESLYGKCKDKSCYLPVLRGLLCTKDRGNLEKWLNGSMELDTTDMVSRQVVQVVVDGLASNDVSRPLLLPYLLDNWPSIYTKFFKTPSLLGNVVNALASGINSETDLVDYKDFLSFYSETVAMAREFQDQAIRAEQSVKWNTDLSTKFSGLFQ